MKKPKATKAAAKARPAPPAPPRSIRPRIMPRGTIWCGTCKAEAPAEGSVTTKHGFSFCRTHK